MATTSQSKSPAEGTQSASFQLIDYVRFAGLTAAQKASARRVYLQAQKINNRYLAECSDVTDIPKPVPLLDCWFLPDGTEVSQHGFFERDPLTQPATVS